MILYLMIFNMILSFCSSDMFLAVLPVLSKTYSVNDAQLSITFYFLGVVISTLFTGICSDIFCKKKLLLTCHIIFFLGCCFCLLFKEYGLFVLGRIFLGIGSGGFMVLGRVIIADTYQNEDLKRKYTIYALVFGILPATLPMIGSYIVDESSWKGVFYLTLIIQLICFMSYLFIIKNDKYKKKRKLKHAFVGVVYHFKFSSKLLKNALLALSVFMICSMLTSISPIYFTKVNGFSIKDYGLIMFAIVLLGQVGKVINIVFSDLKKSIFFGFMMLIFSIILLFISFFEVKMYFLFIAGFCLYINSMGVFLPVLVSNAMSSVTEYRGSASAMYGSLLFVGGAVGSYLALCIIKIVY